MKTTTFFTRCDAAKAIVDECFSVVKLAAICGVSHAAIIRLINNYHGSEALLEKLEAAIEDSAGQHFGLVFDYVLQKETMTNSGPNPRLFDAARRVLREDR
jgi:hypothetical protein